MAKDPRGHGSEKRGLGEGSPFDEHAHRIAVQTLKMPDAMAGVMGGPSKAVAESTLRNRFGYGDKEIAALTGAAHQEGVKQAVPSQNPNYSRVAVDKAIASSNRSGRRIGGREAALIHRILSRP